MNLLVISVTLVTITSTWEQQIEYLGKKTYFFVCVLLFDYLTLKDTSQFQIGSWVTTKNNGLTNHGLKNKDLLASWLLDFDWWKMLWMQVKSHVFLMSTWVIMLIANIHLGLCVNFWHYCGPTYWLFERLLLYLWPWMSFQTSLVLHCIRDVTAHKHDCSTHTSVLTSRFGMVLVQQGEKTVK